MWPLCAGDLCRNDSSVLFELQQLPAVPPVVITAVIWLSRSVIPMLGQQKQRQETKGGSVHMGETSQCEHSWFTQQKTRQFILYLSVRHIRKISTFVTTERLCDSECPWKTHQTLQTTFSSFNEDEHTLNNGRSHGAQPRPARSVFMAQVTTQHFYSSMVDWKHKCVVWLCNSLYLLSRFRSLFIYLFSNVKNCCPLTRTRTKFHQSRHHIPWG